MMFWWNIKPKTSVPESLLNESCKLSPYEKTNKSTLIGI